MEPNPGESTEWREALKLEGGDKAKALAAIFARHRDRLKRMLQLRLDGRMRGRVDESDVLQDAYLSASKRIDRYLSSPTVPMYVWLRSVTEEQLIRLFRRHIVAKQRTTSRDIHFQQLPSRSGGSPSLAQELVGHLTSPSQAVIKSEMVRQVQDALATLSPLDREVLELRHFEQLSNREAALVLQIEESAASKRYSRALVRLQKILAETDLLRGNGT